MKLLLKSIALLTLVLGLCTLCGCGKEGSSAVETKKQALPLLLDLGAHKCPSCQKMTVVLDELTKEYQGLLAVEFIDVWQAENKERAEQYKIETIPTQIFFAASGKELWRHVGFISKEDILAKWKELGYEFTEPAVGKPAV